MSFTMPEPRWDSVAGRVLDDFFARVSAALPTYDSPLTLFGSAPIQLCLDEEFLSADADIMVLSQTAELRAIASEAITSRSAYRIQICPAVLFRPTPHYLQRAWVEMRHGLKIIVPHVRDILIGKLHRTRSIDQDGLVTKDRRAFLRVRELCGGHPTEGELLEDLITCEPHFRTQSDAPLNSFVLNVEDLWQTIFGRRIDIAREITGPARAIEKALIQAAQCPSGLSINDLKPTRD